jgi:hypothetical protein
LPETFHGKEGVDGSSPSEGSEKAAQIAAFSVEGTCTSSNVRWVWSRLWSFQIQDALLVAARAALTGISDQAADGGRRFLAGARYGPISDRLIAVESLVEWPS